MVAGSKGVASNRVSGFGMGMVVCEALLPVLSVGLNAECDCRCTGYLWVGSRSDRELARCGVEVVFFVAKFASTAQKSVARAAGLAQPSPDKLAINAFFVSSDSHAINVSSM